MDDRNKEWINAQDIPLYKDNARFLMSLITEETHHLKDLVKYIDDYYHYKIDVPKTYLKNVGKVITPNAGGNEGTLVGLARVAEANPEKFKEYVEDKWSVEYDWNQDGHCRFAL